MHSKKFDPKKKGILNDPERVRIQNPEAIWRELGLKSPEILVDIGAGTGYFAIPFSEKMPHGVVYACDTSEEMLDWLESHLPDHLAGRIIPVKMKENTVPLPGGQADLVYMINLHHELESPPDMLAEAWRLLKNRGLLAIIDWKKEDTPMGPPASIRITPDEAARQMAEAGFREIIRKADLPYHYFLTGLKTE